MLALARHPPPPPHLVLLEGYAPDEPAVTHSRADTETAMGRFIRGLLLSLGLEPGQLLVDVGCGTGWLAPSLTAIPRLRYIGTDLSPDLLAHTRALVQRDEWRFVSTPGDALPCADAAADFVCQCSLFAHLLPRDAIQHLAEAARVLQSGGYVVFPFFDFALAPETIAPRARKAGLRLEAIVPATHPLRGLDELNLLPNAFFSGAQCCLGQSVAVLVKPPPAIS